MLSWGLNTYGQLGQQNYCETNYYLKPKPINELMDKFVIDMSCGYYHLIVLTKNGFAFGFGRNNCGQIGSI
jgi:alpha-tubulin suppressor-like RCC1 family protein